MKSQISFEFITNVFVGPSTQGLVSLSTEHPLGPRTLRLGWEARAQRSKCLEIRAKSSAGAQLACQLFQLILSPYTSDSQPEG
eukprot:6473932-Amphidinium_carterae.1